MRLRIFVIVAALAAVTPAAGQAPAAAQAPWKGKNLLYFPADITREVLIQRLR